METTIYLITMCSGCQRCSFICCLQLAILIISVMKRKIVASGSYTLMIVSYIPRQPLREYKTNNGQKERKMFLFLVMIHFVSERNFWYWVMYIQDMVQDEISTVYLCCCTKSLSILCMDPCPALVVSLCLSGISIYFVHFHDFCNKKFYKKTCSLIFNEQVFCKIIIIQCICTS